MRSGEKMRWAVTWWFLMGSTGAVGRVVPLLSGWHFDDVVRDSPEPVPSVVVLWSSAWCADAFATFGLNGGKELPSRSHVFLGTYDQEARKKVWWQEEDEGMWLERRFGMERAPAVVFVPAGGDWTKFEMWDGGEKTWQEWVAEKLAVNVRVKNGLSSGKIKVVEADNVTLKPGESLDVSVQPGTRIHVTAVVSKKAQRKGKVSTTATPRTAASAPIETPNTGSFHACDGDGVVSVIFDEALLNLTPTEASAKFQAEDAAMKARDDFLNARDQDTTFTHAAIVRQPPNVPAFDVPAYSAIDLPVDVRDSLWAYYRDHEHERTVESYGDTATGINQHVVNTTLVSLDLDMAERDRIAHLIKPHVEAWAKQPLVFTSFYGIREYHRGHELRMHVDRVATHVFSAIINLRQDGLEEEWPLDVIGFDGIKHSVLMKPNQMLFYQSAKLVHGRPKPLNGSLFASAFVHYKPLEWPYEYGPGDVLLYQGQALVDYKVD